MGIGSGESPSDKGDHGSGGESARPDEEDIQTTCFVHRVIIHARGRKIVQHTEGAAGKVINLAASGAESALVAPAGTVREVGESLARKLVGAEVATLPETAPAEVRAE